MRRVLQVSTFPYGNLLIIQVFSLNASIFPQYRRGRKAVPDPEGDVLADDKEARAHARRIARDMLERRHWYKRGLEHWAFEITNGNGRKVGFVRFSKRRNGA
jgi:hypothetical protein